MHKIWMGFKTGALGLMLAAATLSGALAANIPLISGAVDPANAVQTLNQTIQSINGSVTPGSMAPFAAPRNFIDNGSIDVNQRALTFATCATTAGPTETAYSADRWACDVNMTTGAGRLSVVTATPSPFLGFTNSQTLTRISGALGQPVCALQEIPTIRATQLAGQTVNLSAYMQALAGLAADNSSLANLYLITGTGADQGLGALRSAVGMTSTVKASSVTVATTGVITYTNTLVAGQPVYMTAATMPTGLTSGQYYYVSSTGLTASVFSVASTYASAIAGSVIAPSSTGTTVVVNVPVITPVWTGLAVFGANGAGAAQTSAAQAFGQAFSQAVTLTTAWQRYQTGAITVPTGVTEAAVALCFPPSAASSGGATDGFAFTGVQLEVMGVNQTTASAFEFRPVASEQADALRYAWIIPEPAASVPTPFVGVYDSTTTCELASSTPYPMDIAPTVSFTGTALGATTFAIIAASATPTALATTYIVQSALGANTAQVVGLKATTAGTTAGFGCRLVGAGGAASITIGADF